jgi:hypothetical protein
LERDQSDFIQTVGHELKTLAALLNVPMEGPTVIEVIAVPSPIAFDGDGLTPQFSANWAALYEVLGALQREILDALVEQEGIDGDGFDGDGDVTHVALRENVGRLELRARQWREAEWGLVGVVRDDDTRSLRYRGLDHYFTPREYTLICTLMDSRGHRLTARQLVNQAWGNAALSAEQLRTYVARLRKRFDDGGIPLELVTNRGHGYSISLPAA